MVWPPAAWFRLQILKYAEQDRIYSMFTWLLRGWYVLKWLRGFKHTTTSTNHQRRAAERSGAKQRRQGLNPLCVLYHITPKPSSDFHGINANFCISLEYFRHKKTRSTTLQAVKRVLHSLYAKSHIETSTYLLFSAIISLFVFR